MFYGLMYSICRFNGWPQLTYLLRSMICCPVSVNSWIPTVYPTAKLPLGYIPYTVRYDQSVMLSAFQELYHVHVMQSVFVAYSTSLSPPSLLLLQLAISSAIPQEKLIELAALVGWRDGLVRRWRQHIREREHVFRVKKTQITCTSALRAK